MNFNAFTSFPLSVKVKGRGRTVTWPKQKLATRSWRFPQKRVGKEVFLNSLYLHYTTWHTTFYVSNYTN